MEINNSNDDLRSQPFPTVRKVLINKLLEFLKRYFRKDGSRNLNEVAFSIEKKIFSTAASQSDYIQKMHQNLVILKNRVAARYGIRNSAVSGVSDKTGTQTSRQNVTVENVIGVPVNLATNPMGQMPKSVVLQQQPHSILNQKQLFMQKQLQQGVNLSQKHQMQPNQMNSCPQSSVQATSFMQPSQQSGEESVTVQSIEQQMSRNPVVLKNLPQGISLSHKHHTQHNQMKSFQQSGVQSIEQKMPSKPVVLQNLPQGINVSPKHHLQQNQLKSFPQSGVQNTSVMQQSSFQHSVVGQQSGEANVTAQRIEQRIPRKQVILQQQPNSILNQQGINPFQKHHMQSNLLKSSPQSSVLTTSVTQPSSLRKSVLIQQSMEESVTMQPIDRFTNVVKNISPNELSASCTDIGSVTTDTIPRPDIANHRSVTSASAKSIPPIEVKSMSSDALFAPATDIDSAMNDTIPHPRGTNHGSVTSASEKSMAPIDHLIKVVKSMSSNALRAAADDISSAICLIDRIPESPPVNATTVGAHCGSPTTASGNSNVTEPPIDRLIRTVNSMPPDALRSAVNDIRSVMVDRIAEPGPVNVTEDLAAMTNCSSPATNFITQDGISKTTKRNWSITFDMATSTSSVKKPRTGKQALLEEIRDINQKLVDTVVDISNDDCDRTAAATFSGEGGEGTVVKCSFNGVALSPSLKSPYYSLEMSQIQPLKLLVPSNYPKRSPVLLGNFPEEVCKGYENLSEKTRSRFMTYLRTQVMSVAAIARAWDACARAVVLELAEQSGGGTFSSKFGTWENCAA